MQLQLHILKFISKNSIKSARLVDIKWFRMLSDLHPPGFKLLNNNSQILEILKKSFHRRISKLEIGQYTQSLPIYSSTRCGIPKTEHLVLSDGNSAENIIKLIRYYAESCKSLTLNFRCFGTLPAFHLKGILRFEVIKYLEINVKFLLSSFRCKHSILTLFFI